MSIVIDGKSVAATWVQLNVYTKPIFQVGPSQTYKTISAAIAVAPVNAIVLVDQGTYNETFAISQDGLTLQASSGAKPIIDCNGLRPAWGQAAIVAAGNNITINGFEIKNAVVTTADGSNASAIRPDVNKSLTINSCYLHSCQNGVLTNGGNLTINNTVIEDCGWDDQTHNVYYAVNTTVATRGSLTINNCVISGARSGQEIKSRATVTTITNTVVKSYRGSRCLDICDGGKLVMTGGKLYKGAAAVSNEIVGYAAESCVAGAGPATITGAEIAIDAPIGTMHNFGRCGVNKDGSAKVVLTFKGCTWTGTAPTLTGAVVNS